MTTPNALHILDRVAVLVILLGYALIVVGVALIHLPVALIVAGIGAILIGLACARYVVALERAAQVGTANPAGDA